MIRLTAGNAVVRAVAVAGRAVAVGLGDRSLAAWPDLFAAGSVQGVQPARGYLVLDEDLVPERVWFDPDGRHLTVSLHTPDSTSCGTARLGWPELAPAPSTWANLGWNRLAVSPDARWWATHNTHCLTVRHAHPPHYAHWDPIHYGTITAFAFGPASDRLATVELLVPEDRTIDERRVAVFDVAGKSLRWEANWRLGKRRPRSDPTWVEWSPDGERVAFGGSRQVAVRAADDGRELFALGTSRDRRFGGMAFHPGTGQLAVAASDGTVAMIDPTCGRVGETFRWGEEPLTAVGFSADGTLGVAGGQRGDLVVWDAA